MKEITNELEKTKKSFLLFSRLRKKSNLDSQVWDDFEEIRFRLMSVSLLLQRLLRDFGSTSEKSNWIRPRVLLMHLKNS